MSNDAPQISSTDGSLRQYLQEIFATNSLHTFDEMVDALRERIAFDLDILVYIRERSWFDPIDRPFLVFNFLAFELCGGKLRRFVNGQGILSREDELLANGFNAKESDLCRIIYKSRESENIERVINLIMRILVAFYINCGYHDHFRNSVASRFVREFFKSKPTSSVQQLLSFIENRIGIAVSLWSPRDEMFFADDERTVSELLRPFAGTAGQPLPQFLDEGFGRDLRTSVLRMNQTSGKFGQHGTQYVIRTFAESQLSSNGNEPWSRFKVRQKAVAIFQSRAPNRISLDAVFHACKVIETFIHAFDDLKISTVLMNAERRCFSKETDLAERPVAFGNELYEALNESLGPTIDEVSAIVQASGVAVWVHHPLSNSLAPILARSYDPRYAMFADLPDVSMANSDHLAIRCYHEKQILTLSHPKWIASERAINQKLRAKDSPAAVRQGHRATREDKLQVEFKQRSDLRNSSDQQSVACLVAPIRRGSIVVGVLEVVSGEVGQLTIDTHILERLASICGETLRRLELANDRAWLARMSFLHACRHRVEGLLREVEDRAPFVGNELVTLFREEGFPTSLPTVPTRANTLRRMRETFCAVTDTEAAEKWLNNVDLELKDVPDGDFAYDVLADIAETLVANRSHSPFSIVSLHVYHVRSTQNSNAYLDVRYFPRNWIARERMARIGVSPIPSDTGLTSHYGLFLIGAQIRMLGGFMQSNQESDDIGNCHFGISFKIPVNRTKDN